MPAMHRVSALRDLMRNHSLDAFIVPSEDAHMSEYVADCDQRRAFLTDFDGSAGTALITQDAAFCWTDGRYFVQANKQLDPSVFKLMRMHEDPTVDDWITTNLSDGAVVGVDGRTISISAMKRLCAATALAPDGKRITIQPMPLDQPNFVDTIWGSARPAIPAAPIKVHSIQYAGVAVSDKLRGVRAKMDERKASMLIVAGLDEVAWLLNLRGADIDFNPVFWAYVTVTASTTTLYVNSTRFADGVADHLRESDIIVKDYGVLFPDLASAAWDESSHVWLDPNSCNYAVQYCLERAFRGIKLLRKQSPIALAKARKCTVELDGMRACHRRDGVALVKFLCWLEREVLEVGHEPDEVEAADKLDGLRSEQDLFVSLSFPTISSADANGAIVHYCPDKRTCAKITRDSMYLVDSGAQYRDGTTDVTRTVHFGTPSAWQRECFTRVLQGHIAIDAAVFPKGTTGHLLDGFARQSLWSVGLDYKHGTGHGVGSYLNVHEGPHVISFKPQALDTALEPGFVTSDEPGYYEEDAFGIRIENLCIVVEAGVKGPPGGMEKPFYGMEHVTLAPIQGKLINVELLSEPERVWVDRYHKEVFDKLSPLLEDDPTTLDWLRKNTAKLPKM